jgi:hypothetical protein
MATSGEGFLTVPLTIWTGGREKRAILGSGRARIEECGSALTISARGDGPRGASPGRENLAPAAVYGQL